MKLLKQMKKRRGAAVLMSLMMAFTMFSMMAGTAFAATTDGIVLGADVLGEGANTANAQTVYMADKAWRVIGYGGNGIASSADTMTLFSARNLKGNVLFRENFMASDANHYSKSDLKTEVDAVADTFSDGEKAGIAARDLATGEYSESGTDFIAGDEVKGALLWPLSTKEANETSEALRAHPDNPHWEQNHWWLRSPGEKYFMAASVRGDGRVYIIGDGVPGKRSVRPAFNYNLNSVIFTSTASAAAGGKLSGTVGAGSLHPVGTNSNGEWKLTVGDTAHRSFTVDSVKTCDNIILNIEYSGAVTGNNEYVSAIIKDEDGKIKYYGNLKNCTADGDASGTVEVNVDYKLGEDDTLYVFNEQCNGDKKTDFSSELKEVTITTTSHDLAKMDKVEPTCTTPGTEAYWYCKNCEKKFADEMGETPIDNPTEIDALGHDWNTPDYEWADDLSSVTATRTCKRDATHVETETVNTTKEVTKQPACEEKGETTYTSAAFTNTAFDVQTKTVNNINPIGHEWGEATYKWAEDNKSVTATRVCSRDATHVETETATATSEVTKPATCEEKGETKYTSAAFTNTAFEVQTKTVEDIDALGHDWQFDGFDWQRPGESIHIDGIYATYSCKNDPAHTFREHDHLVITVGRLEPTCEKDGGGVFTAEIAASYSKDGQYHKGEKEVLDPGTATGHKYGAWKNLNATQHQKVCEHDATHVVKENHKWDSGKVTRKATEKATGVKTYTCTVCKATKTETISKLKPSAPKINGMLIAGTTAKGNTGFVISWNQIRGAAGYDIYLARCNHGGKKYTCKKVKTIKGNKTFKWTKSGLKKRTAYKAYVKAYVYKNGKKTYVRTSPVMHAYTGNSTKNYTNAKSVSVNKTKVTLKKGKTFKIKAKVNKVKKNKKLMPKSHAATVRYLTSNSKIAAVNASGKITAKGKGTCNIYALAHNGVSKQVKVTVK